MKFCQEVDCRREKRREYSALERAFNVGTNLLIAVFSERILMKRFVCLLAVLGLVVLVLPESSDAGLFCRAKSCCEPVCCAPAPVCYAPAPVCCAAPVSCCTPEPCCQPRPCLLKRLFSCRRSRCCEPAPCCAPAAAPCCGYGGYGYGVAVNGPHLF